MGKFTINNFLVVILKKMQKKNKEMNIEEQLSYIDKFPHPRDDFDRVYFQYKAKTVENSRVMLFFLNVMATCLLPFFIAFFLLNHWKQKGTSGNKRYALVVCNPNKYGKVFDYSSIIPQKNLIEEFGELYSLEITSYFERLKGVWGQDAFLIWKQLFLRYPTCGYMNLTCLMQIMFINKIMMIYNPDIILEARREESFTSTLITHFCESLNKEYATFMHGFIWNDKSFSFVRFSRIYVWDQFYIKIFLRVNAAAHRFYIYLPNFFSSRMIEKNPIATPADYIYYLSGYGASSATYEESDEYFRQMRKELLALVQSGNHVRIRPHPRGSDVARLRAIFGGSGIEIEDTDVMSINESLSRCKCAIGVYSTVLLQAYYQGIPIVIDDVTDSAVFQEIKERDAIFLYLPHRLLSEIINDLM